MRVKKCIFLFLLSLILSGCTTQRGSASESDTANTAQSAEAEEPKTESIVTDPPNYCAYEGCGKEIPSYSTICTDHVCKTCREIKIRDSVAMQGSDYCENHACIATGCTQPATAGYKYCFSHSRYLNEELMDTRKNLCAASICDNEPLEGSNFCSEHTCTIYQCTNGAEPRYYYCGEHITWEVDRTYFISGKNIKGKSYGESSNHSSHSSQSKHYEYDPDDYDSPEEYADDAWGRDFDDWDDAYDYWENY